MLPPAFEYDVPFTIHEPHGDVSPDTFFKLVAEAGELATSEGLVAIRVADFEPQPLKDYLDKMEPVQNFTTFKVVRQHGGTMTKDVLTATELLAKLQTTEAGPEPRGTPAEEVAAAQAAHHHKVVTGEGVAEVEADAIYTE